MKSVIKMQKEGTKRIGCWQEIILNRKEVKYLNLSFYTTKTSGWKVKNKLSPRCLFFVIPSGWTIEYLDYMKHNISILGNIKMIFPFFLAVQISESNFTFAAVEFGFRVGQVGSWGTRRRLPCSYLFTSLVWNLGLIGNVASDLKNLHKKTGE